MHIEIDLERLLKEKHKSKNFVCEECGLQRTQFNNYCKNKVSRVDLTILAKMCACLDCTPNDILKIVALCQSLGWYLLKSRPNSMKRALFMFSSRFY